jgi:Uma2 family endonuclease
MLRLYADRHPQGKKFLYTASEQTIRTLHSRRRADRVIWIGLGRMPRERTDTPTVAVEFVSPGRRSRVRDYTAKRAEYAEVGISEYWIIDRFRRRLTVIRMANGEQAELVFVEGDTYRTPLMPGFELSVSSLFEESDLLEAEGNDDDDLAP